MRKLSFTLAALLVALWTGTDAVAQVGGLNVQQASTTVVFGARTLNFVSGCTVTGSGSTANVTCAGSGGTVTSVACGTDLSCSPSPITTTGTISLPTTLSATHTFTGLFTLDPASSSNAPLNIDANNATNTYTIIASNLGAGTTGMFFGFSGAGSWESPDRISDGTYTLVTERWSNESAWFHVNGEAFSSAPFGFKFSTTGITNADTTMLIQEQASQTGDALQIQDSSTNVKARVTVGGFVKGFRLYSAGTTLVNTDFALSAGWGNTASVAVTRGSDGGVIFVVTSNGTGQGANPTVTLTFKDLTWTTVPVCQTKFQATTEAPAPAAALFPVVDAPTATTNVMTYKASTPTAGSTYTFNMLCFGT